MGDAHRRCGSVIKRRIQRVEIVVSQHGVAPDRHKGRVGCNGDGILPLHHPVRPADAGGVAAEIVKILALFGTAQLFGTLHEQLLRREGGRSGSRIGCSRQLLPPPAQVGQGKTDTLHRNAFPWKKPCGQAEQAACAEYE